MGLLVKGVWHDKWYDTASNQGEFIRSESQFRNTITPDGQPEASGKPGFKAEKNRYHLYVSLACPWAHRTLIFRELKGLQDMISVSVVNFEMLEQGWTFSSGESDTQDHLYGSNFLYEIYTKASSDYSGRVTVPVLWDKQQETIVSNESSEIIRMLNTAFDHLGAKEGDYYPEEKRQEIDTINERVYSHVNNGVYRAGFATSQTAYEKAVNQLFETLDWLEQKLAKSTYLVGDQITEADWRLFTTLIRFDAVYVGHFKCNLRQIAEYPNLYSYVKRLYQIPGIAKTVNMTHIKQHYYGSHKTINPTGIIPVGPHIDFEN